MKTHNCSHRVWRGFLPAVFFVLGTLIASAHPGHGLSEASATHLLTSPDHFLVLTLSGILLMFGARLIERTLPRRILQAVGVLALTTAAVIWGSHLI